MPMLSNCQGSDSPKAVTAAVSAAARSPAAVLAVYSVPLVAILLSSLLIFYGPRVRAFNAALARAGHV